MNKFWFQKKKDWKMKTKRRRKLKNEKWYQMHDDKRWKMKKNVNNFCANATYVRNWQLLAGLRCIMQIKYFDAFNLQHDSNTKGHLWHFRKIFLLTLLDEL